MYKYFKKIYIERPEIGRRFVIGDIHGCYLTLRTLIEVQLVLTKNDQLFLLGDYIDKGPESKKTVNYIIKLIKKGYKIYPLRGNHEEEKLQIAKNQPDILPWAFRQAKDMLKEGKIKKKYFEFFSELRYYFELDNFFLVHAAFNFKAPNPFEDKESMVWLRRFETHPQFIGDKIIIHGHQPRSVKKVLKNIEKGKKVIGIDCGVNYYKEHKYYDYKKLGKLSALNLDTKQLYIQNNVEVY
jgi:serine/threonine protein phosphatase 1